LDGLRVDRWSMNDVRRAIGQFNRKSVIEGSGGRCDETRYLVLSGFPFVILFRKRCLFFSNLDLTSQTQIFF